MEKLTYFMIACRMRRGPTSYLIGYDDKTHRATFTRSISHDHGLTWKPDITETRDSALKTSRSRAEQLCVTIRAYNGLDVYVEPVECIKDGVVIRIDKEKI